MLLEVPDGLRVSALERWRKGPAVPSGLPGKSAAPGGGNPRAGLCGLEVPGIPHWRMVDLAR